MRLCGTQQFRQRHEALAGINLAVTLGKLHRD